jgi:hypothetical protein
MAMNWLGRRPPRIWALIYIVAIPVAATVFYNLPGGSFYDANLTREPGFHQDLDTLAGKLTSAIRNQEHGDYTGHTLNSPAWTAIGLRFTLDPQSVAIQAGSVSTDSSGNIDFILRGVALTSQKSIPGESVLEIPITLSVSQESEDYTLSGQPLLAGYVATLTTESAADEQPPMNVLFPGGLGQTALSAQAAEILVPPSTAGVIARISAAAQGDPKEASGLFIRMCYFSVTTITTLGFGDITPVTSMARIMVGIEAIAGVILVGLFLNAIAQKLSKE